MGADIVIAVDVFITSLPLDQLTTTIAVMRQTMLIAMQRIIEEEILEADIIISPNVGEIGANEFELRSHAVLVGEMAALDKIANIRQVISGKGQGLKSRLGIAKGGII
ncbi:hypothetical protein ACFL2V_08885 [Pseudomonadota bacterium]